MVDVIVKIPGGPYPRDLKSGDAWGARRVTAPIEGRMIEVGVGSIDTRALAKAIAEVKAGRVSTGNLPRFMNFGVSATIPTYVMLNDRFEPVAEVKPANEPVDPKARRAARDKRVREILKVIHALHGHTLAELAK